MQYSPHDFGIAIILNNCVLPQIQPMLQILNNITLWYILKFGDIILLLSYCRCKGLFLDTEKGNILKLSHDGKILR